MAEIVNLRRARKARIKAEAEARAGANRIAFGRTKAEKKQSEAEKALQASRLDGHRLTGEKPGKDEA